MERDFQPPKSFGSSVLDIMPTPWQPHIEVPSGSVFRAGRHQNW